MAHSANHDPHHHPAPQPWAKLKRFLFPERGDIIIVVIYALFVALLSLATPIAVEAMVSTVSMGVVLWPIVWLALILFACLTLAGTIRLVEMWVLEMLQRRLFVRTVASFAEKLPRTALEVYDTQSGPTLVNRFLDVVTVQKSVAFLLLEGVALFLTITIGMIVLAVYHPLLLVFDLGLILALTIVALVGRGAVRTAVDESHAKYDVVGWLEEVARIPATFKTGHGPALAITRADELTHHYLDHRRAHYRVVFRQYFLAVVVQIIANVLLLSMGGWLVIQRQLTIGQLVAAELIISFVVGSLLKLNKYLDSWYDLCAAIEKIDVVNTLPQERVSGAPLERKPQGMSLAVRDLELSVARPLIGGLNWIIEPNEKIGLTGRGGSGKSVLLEIVAGLREPSSGYVQLDGFDMRELHLDSVRQQVQIVREVQVFAGTLQDNLCVGCPDVTLTEIRDALQTVNLDGVLQTLPDGLNTMLTPSGRPLSTSEALRLGVARALISRPRLLILDGVLDQLDLQTTPELLDILFAPTAPFTLLIVSGDPAILRRCDRVLGIEPVSPTLN